MARQISLLKLLACVTLVYSSALTIMYLSMNQNIDCETLKNDLQPLNTGTKGSMLGSNGDSNDKDLPDNGRDSNSNQDKGDNKDWGPHKLAVIIPFRDRFEELMEFAPHLHLYLTKKHVRHKILAINQVDTLR